MMSGHEEGEAEGDSHDWVVSTTRTLYKSLLYDTHQAILFLPAANGANLGETQDESGTTPSDDREKPGITGDEARTFYEDVISRPGTAVRERQFGDRGKNTEVEGKRRQRKRVCHTKSPPSKDARRSVAKTELFRLAQEGETDALRAALSEGGHDINARDHFDWTLLMCASHAGHVTTVQYLMDNGARWRDVTDKKGNTAIDLARISGHFHIVQMMEERDRKVLDREGERESSQKCSEKVTMDSRLSDSNDSFHCEVCGMDVSTGRSRRNHETSVVHQFNCQHAPAVSPYVIPETNRGYRLLLRGGWDPEAGLGSQKQGPKFPVKTVLKQDRRGLGEPPQERSLPRVTHFSAYDTDAVRSSRDRSGVSAAGTVQRKKKDVLKAVEKERRWEIRMRRYMNAD